MNVWVAPLDDLAAAKPVTQDKKRGIRSYRWAFTNQHVLYEQDTGGDEDFHLYGVDIADKTTKDLTPLKKIRVSVLADSPKFPEELLVGLNDRDPTPADRQWFQGTALGPGSVGLVPVVFFAAGRPQNRRHKDNNDDGNHEKRGIDVHDVQGSLLDSEYQTEPPGLSFQFCKDLRARTDG